MAQEDQHSLQAKFAAAVKVIWSLPKQGPFQLSDDMMLMFYSYYKQATVGPCTFTRPTGFWASHEKNKWDAWSSLGNMSKEEAMKNYVENIQLILETMPVSNEVSDLVRQLGNFYLEEEEGEENEAESRPFTRPFAKQAELVSPKKPAMEGYGDLWDDIQNFQEETSMSFNGAEAVECEEDIGYLRKEEMGEVDNVDEEDEADGEGWGLEPRPHAPQDTTWRCCTRASGSSVEPSVSSLTNGTHSSLDSEVEEEELAYSKQHRTCGPIYVDFHGHLLDHNHAVKQSYHLADSDNEEFCDSMDDPTMDKLLSTSQIQSGGSTCTLGKEHGLWFESSSALKAEDRSLRVNSCDVEPHKAVRESPSPKTACSCQLWLRTCDSVSECTRHSPATWANVNEQIIKALLKLQDDMSDALHRLHTLEGLTVAQHFKSSSSLSRCADTPPLAQKFFTPSWWPFDHSPITMVMTTLWPAIAFGLVQLYSRRKRR